MEASVPRPDGLDRVGPRDVAAGVEAGVAERPQRARRRRPADLRPPRRSARVGARRRAGGRPLAPSADNRASSGAGAPKLTEAPLSDPGGAAAAAAFSPGRTLPAARRRGGRGRGRRYPRAARQCGSRADARATPWHSACRARSSARASAHRAGLVFGPRPALLAPAPGDPCRRRRRGQPLGSGAQALGSGHAPHGCGVLPDSARVARAAAKASRTWAVGAPTAAATGRAMHLGNGRRRLRAG